MLESRWALCTLCQASLRLRKIIVEARRFTKSLVALRIAAKIRSIQIIVEILLSSWKTAAILLPEPKRKWWCVMKYIKRHMEEIMLSPSKSRPVILLTRPRQAGFKGLPYARAPGASMSLLDDLNMQEMAKNDPKMSQQLHKLPVQIDEVLYAPELFTYIKIHADDHHHPRDFRFTGLRVFQLMHAADRIGVYQQTIRGLRRADNGRQFFEIFDRHKPVFPPPAGSHDSLSAETGSYFGLFSNAITSSVFIYPFVRFLKRPMASEA